MAATEKLYIKDVYQRTGDMELLQLKEENGCLLAAFDKTVFFPTGGGQLCDTGSIGGFPVTDVKEEKGTGIIWHALEAAEGRKPEVGRVYAGEIDWQKRFSHMQMHCGEHILSGAFFRLFGAVNKGFHMGEEYVTIDIDLPSESGYPELTKEMEAEAELLANSAVWQDLPVNTYYFDTLKEAKALPLRKDIKAETDISVVVVGDKEDPADCCACCGTHPRSAGEIGIIKITHSEKYKGMTRFYVKCGLSAYRDYCEKQALTDSISRHFSCEPAKVEAAIAALESKKDETYKKYSAFKAYILGEEEQKIREMLASPSDKSIRMLYSELLSADDYQALARKLEKEIREPFAFVATRENTIILASSGTPDCGKLVKENAGIYKGKGGGKPGLARAIFNSGEDVELFLDLTEKHLR